MESTDYDTKDFILKVLHCSSLLDELQPRFIKEHLSTFVLEYDLTREFFDLYFQTLDEKNYSVIEILASIQTPFSEILKTLKGLQKIIESCFTENNLKNNQKLKNLIAESSDGFIPIANFLKYKNVKSLTGSEIFLAKALEGSSLIEVSADRRQLRLISALKPDDTQVFYYNLDTSQTQITYSSISEGLPLRPTIITRIKNITMLAGNSKVVCYFKPDVVHKVDLATGEDKIVGQIKGLTYMDVKSDEDLFLGVIEKHLIILYNLNSSKQVFECRVSEGGVEKVVFHPNEKNLLARFSQSEVVIFKYSIGKGDGVSWFKVVPMKQRIINIALNSNLLAVAFGQGQIMVVNTDSDAVLALYSPHTYNTMMYSSVITLHFINNNFLLSSGRSQNEFCMMKIDTKEKSHVLSIQSLSKKSISFSNNCILITDASSSGVSLIIITEIEGLLKFSKIIDYKLDSNCMLACLTSMSQFFVVTKLDCRSYLTNIESKPEERSEVESSIETSEIISTVNSLLASKFKTVQDKISNFSKLNQLKKCLNDSITETSEKNLVKDHKQLQEDIKKCVHDTLAGGLSGALEEMLTQAYQFAENGVKEFTQKEYELDSVYSVLQKENIAKLTLINDVVDIYAKNCFRQIKKIEKLDERYKEKLLTLKGRGNGGIQEKINILLAQGDYETALGMVVQYSSKLYATLAVMNPYGLLQSKRISQGLHNRILKQFLVFPPTAKQLPNSAEWLECLITNRIA